MKSIHPSRLLKLALLADATGSAAVGTAQLLHTAALSDRLQLPHALLLETGVLMLVYAAALLWLMRRARVSTALISAVVAGNIVWALACVALLVSGTPPTNALGAGFLLMQACAVLIFAGFQFKGLRTSSPAELDRAAAVR